MLEFLRSIPLTGVAAEATTWFVLILSICMLVWAQPTGKRLRNSIVCAAIAVLLAIIGLTITVGFLDISWGEIHPLLIAATICLLMSLLLTGAALITQWQKLWTLAPLAFVMLSCVLVGNQAYALYPDVETLFPDVSYNTIEEKDLPAVNASDKTISAELWRATEKTPDDGSRLSMNIPTPQSGFQARPADVYLPPAWFSTPRPELPVLVLLHGIPGAPSQWFDEGGGLKTIVDYQKLHDGLAPIVVSVDATGGWVSDPVCTDSPRAKVRTYLTKDVPSWLITRLGANPDQSSWTLGGLSYGGTCALQTVSNAPDSFGTFLDYSGEFTPNNGEGHQSTLQNFFNNSEKEFAKRNPADILSRAATDGTAVFSETSGRFVAGLSDHAAQEDLRRLHGLAKAAGIQSTFRTLPGGHDFRVWRTALRQDFAWIAERGGLPR